MKFNFTFLFVLFLYLTGFSQTQISGTQNFSFCYENYQDYQITYQSVDGSALRIVFNSGSLEDYYDTITIIDGNGSGNILLNEFSGDLNGIDIIASSGFITLVIESDVSISCEDGDFDPIQYSITTTGCIYPTYTVNQLLNCSTVSTTDNSLVLNVTNMNGATSFTFTANGQTQTITTVGSYTFHNISDNSNVSYTLALNSNCTATGSISFNCIIESATCADAFEIPVGNTPTQYRLLGDNTNGFENYDYDNWQEIYCGGEYGVWFKVIVPNGISSLNIAQFEVNDADAMYDGYLTVFRGTCSNLVELACEDDSEVIDDPDEYTNFPQLQLTNLIPGETLYILATGYGYGTGLFEVAAWNPTLSTSDFNFKENTVKLYPNPASDILNIQSENEIKNVEIFNLVGQSILKVADKNQINVSNLASGTYMVKTETIKGIQTSKFIKK